jgi:hypothetical protein
MKIKYINPQNQAQEYELVATEILPGTFCPLDKTPLIYSQTNHFLRCKSCGTIYGSELKIPSKAIQIIAEGTLEKTIQRKADFENILNKANLSEETTRQIQGTLDYVNHIIQLAQDYNPELYKQVTWKPEETDS